VHKLFVGLIRRTDCALCAGWRGTLKVQSFFEHAEIQENAITELRAITESAFQEAFQQWKKRWERCIVSRGDYFEGDSA
jgi:hypothetical protein